MDLQWKELEKVYLVSGMMSKRGRNFMFAEEGSANVLTFHNHRFGGRGMGEKCVSGAVTLKRPNHGWVINRKSTVICHG